MGSREYTIREVREIVIDEYGENIPENKWIAYGHLKKELGLSGEDRKWLPEDVFRERSNLIGKVLDILWDD